MRALHASTTGRAATAAVGLFALIAAAAGCGSSSSSTSSAGGAASGGAAGSGSTVEIKNFSFMPGSLSVPKGTTVTWKNDDSTKHTATADDKSFDTKDISGNASAAYTFNTAGTFKYHCDIHNYMTGTITVSG